jgi:hypothetical protein
MRFFTESVKREKPSNSNVPLMASSISIEYAPTIVSLSASVNSVLTTLLLYHTTHYKSYLRTVLWRKLKNRLP